jgi:uncharacterized membrane protein YhhN
VISSEVRLALTGFWIYECRGAQVGLHLFAKKIREVCIDSQQRIWIVAALICALFGDGFMNNAKKLWKMMPVFLILARRWWFYSFCNGSAAAFEVRISLKELWPSQSWNILGKTTKDLPCQK